MANESHRPILVVENDMAVLAQGKEAVKDMEALMLKLTQKPIATLDDISRIYDDLYDIAASHAVIGKYLTAMRSREDE